MILLKEIQSGNPFEDYPQLKEIWPEPFNTYAKEAVEEHLQFSNSDIDIGAVYLICKGDKVIGITGYFIYNEEDNFQAFNPHTENLGLRWHGIIPEYRGQGISEQVMTDMLTKTFDKYIQPKYLIELVPLTEYGQPLAKHFTKLGFETYGTSERYDWSDFPWQPYRLDIQKFLQPKAQTDPKPSFK